MGQGWPEPGKPRRREEEYRPEKKQELGRGKKGRGAGDRKCEAGMGREGPVPLCRSV